MAIAARIWFLGYLVWLLADWIADVFKAHGILAAIVAAGMVSLTIGIFRKALHDFTAQD